MTTDYLTCIDGTLYTAQASPTSLEIQCISCYLLLTELHLISHVEVSGTLSTTNQIE